MTAGPRSLAAAAIVALLPAFCGCQIHASTYREYWKEGAKYPAEGQAEPEPVRAPKKDDLVCGVRKLRIADAETADRDDLRDLGDPKEVGRAFADELGEAKVFKDVHFPPGDHKIDVEIEPVLRVGLDKRRGTNFVKIFPGIVFPWIDGFGFNYDHTIELEIRVRDPQRPEVVCDTFRASSALEAKRYPSIFWLAGLHASLFVLLIFETVSTDDAVCERLAEKDAQLASRAAIEWLAREFAPTSRECPFHPGLKANAGARQCVVCKTNLRYPILNRVDGKAAEVTQAAPAEATGTGTGTGTTSVTPTASPDPATGTASPK